MPIAGLTDRKSVRPRFTCLGKIRKGTKDKQGNLVDLDYFRFVAASPEVQEAFEDMYGEKPQVIRVLLPYRTMEENWETWQEEWGKSGLIHRCNGIFMVQWQNSDKSYARDPDMLQERCCPYEAGEKQRTKQSLGCKQVGYLSVMIPELLEIGHLGYVVVETHSLNDLANITASILQAEDAARNAGNSRLLQGIEFIMRRVPEDISVRWKGKDGAYRKTRQERWMIRLDPAQEWALRMIKQSKQEALGLLPAQTEVVLDAVVVEEEIISEPAPVGLPEPTEEVPESPEPEEEDTTEPPELPVDFEEFHTLPFLTEYSDMDTGQLKEYAAHICGILIGIGYGVKAHRTSLLKQMFGTADFKQYVVGWFRLLEQYGLHIHNAKERGKAKEYAKEVVALGVEKQVDWFGVVELLAEADSDEKEEAPPEETEWDANNLPF